MLRPLSAVVPIGLLSVLGCSPHSLTITTSELPDAILQAPYDQQLTATGGQPPLRWSLPNPPSQASWLGIDEAQGQLLSTTPPTQLAEGLVVTVHVEDALGSTAERALALNIRDCQGDGDVVCAQASDGGVCESGVRHCQGGQAEGCELSGVSSDPKACGPNCGNCGVIGNACVDGKCVCGSGQAVCGQGQSCCGEQDGGSCVNTASDVNNCGLCGAGCDTQHAPHTLPSCQDGVCQFQQCEPGWSRCGADASAPGCPTHVDADVNNCGACGKKCPAASSFPAAAHVAGVVCAAGGCELVCAPDYADCDGNLANGCEVHAVTASHCGSCAACPALGPHAEEADCESGVCVVICDTPFDSCGASYAQGCPFDLSSDTDNCRGCGNVCPQVANATPHCAGSGCGFTCQPGFSDCNHSATDGCEANFASDPANCGGCGRACPQGGSNTLPACTTGSCSTPCKPGFGDCNHSPTDGCEVETDSDPSNCGACGNHCHSGSFSSPACVAGSCALTCQSGHADCDQNLANGCETSLHNSQNCGACGVACGPGSSCVSCPSGFCCN